MFCHRLRTLHPPLPPPWRLPPRPSSPFLTSSLSSFSLAPPPLPLLLQKLSSLSLPSSPFSFSLALPLRTLQPLPRTPSSLSLPSSPSSSALALPLRTPRPLPLPAYASFCLYPLRLRLQKPNSSCTLSTHDPQLPTPFTPTNSARTAAER